MRISHETKHIYNKIEQKIFKKRRLTLRFTKLLLICKVPSYLCFHLILPEALRVEPLDGREELRLREV